MGFGSSGTSARAAARVSSSSPIPGPSATASRGAASSATISRAFSANVRAPVSGKGSVIASRTRPATTGCWLAGVATVTSPTPLRSAAAAARDSPFGGAPRARAEGRAHDHVRPREGLHRGVRVLHEPGPHAAPPELPELAAGVAADLALGEREQDVGPHPRALEPACHDEAVAAVTALAADDGHARPTPGRLESAEQRHDPCGGAAAGVFHEGRTGDAELGDRAAIEAPHLLRREHPVHGGYRPGS